MNLQSFRVDSSVCERWQSLARRAEYHIPFTMNEGLYQISKIPTR